MRYRATASRDQYSKTWTRIQKSESRLKFKMRTFFMTLYFFLTLFYTHPLFWRAISAVHVSNVNRSKIPILVWNMWRLHLCSVENPVTVLGTIYKHLVLTDVLFDIETMSEDAKTKISGELSIILNPPLLLRHLLFFSELNAQLTPESTSWVCFPLSTSKSLSSLCFALL
jgi:hypothetical protein